MCYTRILRRKKLILKHISKDFWCCHMVRTVGVSQERGWWGSPEVERSIRHIWGHKLVDEVYEVKGKRE